jgi:hypothetical protein
MSDSSLLGRAKRVATRWRTGLVAVATVVGCELGARIGLPGTDGRIVQAFIRAGAGGLLRFYDILAGGTIARAAVLALGIFPYLSARVYVRIARATVPAVGDLASTPAGRRRLRSWTRGLTAAIALVQSYGYAWFLQSIPGAVAHPGASFIGQTMLILTAGSIVVGRIGEGLTLDADVDPVERAATKNESMEVQSLDTSIVAPSPLTAIARGESAGALMIGPGALQPLRSDQPVPSTVDARLRDKSPG